MIQREAGQKLTDLASKFKAVAMTGPRQSGKTTLVKQVFSGKPYLSLENPDTRNFALDDPRGFLQSCKDGAILDEIQRTPLLFSYLQEVLDHSKTKGLFVLTGSNNFLMQENISQSLAGRIGYMNLLPFSVTELMNGGLLPANDDDLMYKGFYPPVYDQGIPAGEWCRNYIRTYIEKDVRQIKNITDLIVFERFLMLLAGRNGQELNSSALAVETGVDVKTIQSWIGILATSFIIYLLRPHHKNFRKTIVKRPKIYFYDSALVCSLLGITGPEQLALYPLRGAIFEGMVITEFVKKRVHSGLPVNLYYWRDKAGHEVDLIVDHTGSLIPIEIKSGKTISNEFFRNLNYWCQLSGSAYSYVLYGGSLKQVRGDDRRVMNWRDGVQAEF